MASATYPLLLDKALARRVAKAVESTGLSKAELMRLAVSVGLPKVLEALGKSDDRLTRVDPLPPRQARALYRLKDDDAPSIKRLMSAQIFEVSD